jgi:hypothetical protein
MMEDDSSIPDMQPPSETVEAELISPIAATRLARGQDSQAAQCRTMTLRPQKLVMGSCNVTGHPEVPSLFEDAIMTALFLNHDAVLDPDWSSCHLLNLFCITEEQLGSIPIQEKLEYSRLYSGFLRHTRWLYHILSTFEGVQSERTISQTPRSKLGSLAAICTAILFYLSGNIGDPVGKRYHEHALQQLFPRVRCGNYAKCETENFRLKLEFEMGKSWPGSVETFSIYFSERSNKRRA